ncbi:MAG: methionine sulfoxide reductase [Bacteroidetes bacterium CG12_big_fil_rev_8_21_14_0_65_60_17]|nr:MAG: methionine sulfoxide reductase [Bacteroidetes bacterium CG12_big_fil_rev_8_21_14_0_65_60_17]
MKKNALTPEEAHVILHKGTEPPFSGVFCHHMENGSYVCRQCGAPLYRSNDKFDSGCGWPSFDAEIDGAVERIPDVDGRRTEIVCARCKGHLGHVFTGEGFTPRNTRHCVNSISLAFEPRTERALFASGCFWGTDFHFMQQEGVLSTRVGYCGGHVPNPSYREVCGGRTGHAETVEVVFDSGRVSFEDLVKLFFETHDPGQRDRQGPDVGTQYRSAIFYLNEAQRDTALRLIEELRQGGTDVVTEVTLAGTFWEAEDDHQNYYARTGGHPYCHVYTKRFA